MQIISKGKTNYVYLAIILLISAIVGGGIWWWQESLKTEMPEPINQIEDETENWQTYANKEYGFEIKYPEDLLLNPPLEASSIEYIGNGKKYVGIYLGEFNNGCSLNIFKTNLGENINPFDKTDISIKMRRYAVSEKIKTDNAIYHFGMSVASHAVSPESCKSLLNQMLSTFRFLE